MNTLTRTLLVCFFALYGLAAQAGHTVVTVVQPAAVATCSPWIAQTTGLSVDGIATYAEQSIRNAGSVNVCTVLLRLDQAQAGTQVNVQVFQGGSQVGGDSNTVTYSDNGWKTFTFSPAVSVTGDFVIRLTKVSGQPYYFYPFGTDAYEEGSGYDVVGQSGRDMAFEVWTQ